MEKNELLEALWTMVEAFAPFNGISEEQKEAAVIRAYTAIKKAEGNEGGNRGMCKFDLTAQSDRLQHEGAMP